MLIWRGTANDRSLGQKDASMSADEASVFWVGLSLCSVERNLPSQIFCVKRGAAIEEDSLSRSMRNDMNIPVPIEKLENEALRVRCRNRTGRGIDIREVERHVRHRIESRVSNSAELVVGRATASI